MFKSKRALMFLALALVVAMTVMTPLAIACDTGGSNGGNKPGSSDNSKGNKNDSNKNSLD